MADNKESSSLEQDTKTREDYDPVDHVEKEFVRNVENFGEGVMTLLRNGS